MLTKSYFSLSLESKTAATLQCKPFLWNQRFLRGMRPVFQQEVLLTRLNMAQRVFNNTGWSLCFQSIATGSFRSLLPPRAQIIGFGKRSCSSLIAACWSVLMNSRPIVARDTLRFRKEQFSACSDAHIATWSLCRRWRLFGWFRASLLFLSSPLHQGMLWLHFAGLQRIWRSLSTPWLSISFQVGKGLLLTSATRASDFPVWFGATHTEWIQS